MSLSCELTSSARRAVANGWPAGLSASCARRVNPRRGGGRWCRSAAQPSKSARRTSMRSSGGCATASQWIREEWLSPGGLSRTERVRSTTAPKSRSATRSGRLGSRWTLLASTPLGYRLPRSTPNPGVIDRPRGSFGAGREDPMARPQATYRLPHAVRFVGWEKRGGAHGSQRHFSGRTSVTHGVRAPDPSVLTPARRVLTRFGTRTPSNNGR